MKAERALHHCAIPPLRGRELRYFLLLLLHGSVIPKIEATNHKVWATRKAIMVRLVVLHHHASVSTSQLLLLAFIRRYVFCTNYITALYRTTLKLHTTKYSNIQLQHRYSSSIFKFQLAYLLIKMYSQI